MIESKVIARATNTNSPSQVAELGLSGDGHLAEMK